jgi:hypothetical protein
MAEIGVVNCGKVALRVGQAVLPAYRRKFSARQVPQPRLLAILGLRCDEAQPFREAAGRLAEHGDLWTVLRLRHAPDYITPYRVLRRLGEAMSAQASTAGPLTQENGVRTSKPFSSRLLTPEGISTPTLGGGGSPTTHLRLGRRAETYHCPPGRCSAQ